MKKWDIALIVVFVLALLFLWVSYLFLPTPDTRPRPVEACRATLAQVPGCYVSGTSEWNSSGVTNFPPQSCLILVSSNLSSEPVSSCEGVVDWITPVVTNGGVTGWCCGPNPST
ncbi:MAG: hypothetical protein ABH803_04025 [Candidatus Micrarchaeota archaeon]